MAGTTAQQAIKTAEIAIAAAEEEKRRKDKASREQKAALEQRIKEFRERAVAYAHRMLDESPLEQWFPGTEWLWFDIPMNPDDGQSCFVVGPADAGTPAESFRLRLSRADRPMGPEHLHVLDPQNREGRRVGVYITSREQDSGTGYSYWSSSRFPVTGPADIGRYLIERNKNAGLV
jgi:hypothetical protein